jgi:hypothetical protein
MHTKLEIGHPVTGEKMVFIARGRDMLVVMPSSRREEGSFSNISVQSLETLCIRAYHRDSKPTVSNAVKCSFSSSNSIGISERLTYCTT